MAMRFEGRRIMHDRPNHTTMESRFAARVTPV